MSASAIPGLVTPAATELTQVDELGRMKLSLVICGMQAVIEGHAVALEPHLVHFFALAERLVEHNIETARRSLEVQQQALLVHAAGRGDTAAH